MKKSDKVLLGIAGPVLALAVAFVLTTLVLLASGLDPVEPYSLMVQEAEYPDIQVLILNQTGTYYLAALAVAVGFRMNLFNIGVDGQYRLAAMLAAVVGAAVELPGPLHVLLIVLVAVLVGAFWAGVAGFLKTTRGVSEVVSTIMLNAIATSLIAWLILPANLGEQLEGSNDLTTGEIAESGWMTGLAVEGGNVYGFTFVAFALGAVYWFVLNRTRFGFDLRATGASESAAQASGVDARKMVLTAMLISGGVAGLTGLPLLLGQTHTYSLAFPAGVGFTGITIALLGRNHPVGLFFAALLVSFLEKASASLDQYGYPKEITTIMKGLIVIAVVVSYELVRQYGLRRQQRKVGEELAARARENKEDVAA